MYSDTYKLLFKMLRNVINNEVIKENISKVAWAEIYQVSQKHNIVNLIAYAIDKMNNKPDTEVIDLFEEDRTMNIVKEGCQEVEGGRIMDMFEQAHIRHMVLKGYILKKLYPLPDMRTMCDIDILVDDKQIDDAIRLMQSLDYPICENGAREIVYKRPPFISVEIHRALVSEKYHKRIFDYYKNIWDMAVLDDNKRYSYKLINEDFYVYMVVHLAKHYISGGTGIRSILDVYVFLKKYKQMLNENYLDEEFKKIKLSEFRCQIEKLIGEWFENEDETDMCKEMTQYILNGGTYGSKIHSDAIFAIREGNMSVKGSMIKKKLQVICPSYANMCCLYPKLNGHKVLLPGYWVYRIMDRAINRRDRVKCTLKKSDLKKSDIDYVKHHLQMLNLIDK